MDCRGDVAQQGCCCRGCLDHRRCCDGLKDRGNATEGMLCSSGSGRWFQVAIGMSTSCWENHAWSILHRGGLEAAGVGITRNRSVAVIKSVELGACSLTVGRGNSIHHGGNRAEGAGSGLQRGGWSWGRTGSK